MRIRRLFGHWIASLLSSLVSVIFGYTAISSIASKIECTAQTLRNWVRQAERDLGLHGGMRHVERERLKELERENHELKRVNKVLRKASAFFRTGGARPPREVIMAFIDAHHAKYGVEPVCAQLPIVPSTYHERRAPAAALGRLPARARFDRMLSGEFQCV